MVSLPLSRSQIPVAELVQSRCRLGFQPRPGGRALTRVQRFRLALTAFRSTEQEVPPRALPWLLVLVNRPVAHASAKVRAQPRCFITLPTVIFPRSQYWLGRCLYAQYWSLASALSLPKRDIDAMIDGVIGNRFLPASIRQDIIERTDGIPLFVEEITKAVLEVENEGVTERAAAAMPSSAAVIPATLHASLMARLDRLGPAKEVAQIGAAIGREFSHRLLTAVVSGPEVQLDRLVQSGLLLRRGVASHASYLFKHALVQDAAYSTLLRSKRHELHSHIASVLEQHFSEVCETQPEVLARHYTQAGMAHQAISYWQRAGDRATKRSANQKQSHIFGTPADCSNRCRTEPPTPSKNCSC
jgi:hypothetical protein